MKGMFALGALGVLVALPGPLHPQGYPNGQESADALYLTAHEDAMGTFEAPEHD